MGFVKDLGGLTGCGVGVYFSGIIGIVGSVVGSDSIEQFCTKVYDASVELGEKLGDIAENVVETSIDATKSAVSAYSERQNMITEQDSNKIEKALDVFGE